MFSQFIVYTEPASSSFSVYGCYCKSIFPVSQHSVSCKPLRLKNETAAQRVLTSIETYFQTQPFDFRGAHIITGQEEGVYGWITVNYLLGNFLEVCEKKLHALYYLIFFYLFFN